MSNLWQVFEHVNWKLLAQQKQALVESLDSQGNSENLEGILNLVDAIQDAAEKDGFPVVFEEVQCALCRCLVEAADAYRVDGTVFCSRACAEEALD